MDSPWCANCGKHLTAFAGDNCSTPHQHAPRPINVATLPQAQRKVRLLHKNGLAFDFVVGKDFSLNAVVTSIRANGFLLVHEQAYIPQEDICMLFFLAENAVLDKPAQVIQFPDNPVKT